MELALLELVCAIIVIVVLRYFGAELWQNRANIGMAYVTVGKSIARARWFKVLVWTILIILALPFYVCKGLLVGFWQYYSDSTVKARYDHKVSSLIARIPRKSVVSVKVVKPRKPTIQQGKKQVSARRQSWMYRFLVRRSAYSLLSGRWVRTWKF